MKLQTITKKSEQYLIDGIATNNSKVLNEIYAKYSKPIGAFVKKNSGTLEDAQDIFQEGIISIYQISKKKEIILTSSFFTYLYTICQRLWWKKLRKANKAPHLVAFDKIMENQLVDDDINLEKELYQLYLNKFEVLAEKKQKVLMLYFKGHSMREITKMMNLKNETYARKFKYECKEQLKKLIHNDKRYYEFVQ